MMDYYKPGHNIMSQYSYNYSVDDAADPDNAHFLDHSLPLSFDLDRLDAPKPAEGATNYTEELPGTKARRGRGVLEVGEESRGAYLRARRGRGDETMQLHPNFKTLARRHLRDLIYLKLLGEKQRENCLAFLRSSPSFASLRALLHPQGETGRLRASLLGFFGSAAAVRQIQGSRACVQQKLLMVKFLQRLREALLVGQNGRKWKSL